ncbi:MAG: class I SAM-dependent methyltransferase [Desulfonatronovibrionaceae bacterium]
MDWTREAAQRYDAWVNSGQGRFALAQEKRLMQHLISFWPRRKQSLLEIGCGTGVFLEMFWEAGFDVTGVDISPEMLSRARHRLGGRADLHLADGAHLPFEDKEFDFAALIAVLEFCPDPAAVVREAARVSRKELFVAFLNRHSLYYLSAGRKGKKGKESTLHRAQWYSWLEMSAILRRALGKRSVYSRSVLATPPAMWTESRVCRFLSRPILPPFMGAFIGMRVDILNKKPLHTPLMAFKAEVRPDI